VHSRAYSWDLLKRAGNALWGGTDSIVTMAEVSLFTDRRKLSSVGAKNRHPTEQSRFRDGRRTHLISVSTALRCDLKPALIAGFIRGFPALWCL
jgi:hypothetical protein